MTPFYFIDGPLKGQIIESDFRPLTYVKWTYAMSVQKGDNIIRLICDVASCEKITATQKLPKEAYGNMIIEVMQGELFEVGPEVYEQLELVNDGGMLKKVEL